MSLNPHDLKMFVSGFIETTVSSLMVLEKMKMRKKNTTKRKATPTTKDAGKIVSIIKR